VIGTAVLLLVIFCVVDRRNSAHPTMLTAVTVGLTVTLLISLLGPLTMACFNPARDLAPRLFSVIAGWGWLPFQVNGWGWLTVYVLAPCLGGLLGGGIYTLLLRPAYRSIEPPPCYCIAVTGEAGPQGETPAVVSSELRPCIVDQDGSCRC
jgi:hypothetical protein